MSAQTIHKSQKVSKADVVFNIILYGICGLILLLIAYAVKWAAPIRFPNTTFGNPAPIMPVKGEMEHSVQGLHDQKSIS